MITIEQNENKLIINAHKCGHNFHGICTVYDFFEENNNHIIHFPKPLGINIIKQLIEKIEELITLKIHSLNEIEKILNEINF